MLICLLLHFGLCQMQLLLQCSSGVQSVLCALLLLNLFFLQAEQSVVQ